VKSRLHLLKMDMAGSWKSLGLAAAGIMLAVFLCGFFLAFFQGMEQRVIPAFVPLDRLEVRKAESHLDLGPLRLGLGGGGITGTDLEKLRSLPGVRAVFPSLSLDVPVVIRGGGRLLGSGFSTEAAIQGLDPDLLSAETADGYVFQSRSGSDVPCRDDDDCETGLFCSGEQFGPRFCRPPIPAMLSPRLIRLFNLSLRKAYGMPRLNPDSLIGLKAEVFFGASTLGGGKRRILLDHLQLVGYSERVNPVGVAIPLEEVRRISRFFGNDRKVDYDTAVLSVEKASDLARTARTLRKTGYRPVDDGAEKIASALRIIRILGLCLALVVFLIAALGAGQGFTALLQQRKHEIGILWALGASRRDIGMLFVAEAGIAASLGAGAGIFLSHIAAMVIHIFSRQHLASIPGLPDNLFFFGFLPMALLFVVAVLLSMVVALVVVLAFSRRIEVL